MDFWDIFGIVADFAGIISLMLGIITLAMAVGIKTSLIRHVEKSAYLSDIDDKILELESLYETLDKDSQLYNCALLDRIDADLDDIYICYETILPKKIIKEITSLRDHIKNKCYKNLYDREAKRECKTQLHSICSRLRKEKKLL